jgi:hypothetical protein
MHLLKNPIGIIKNRNPLCLILLVCFATSTQVFAVQSDPDESQKVVQATNAYETNVSPDVNALTDPPDPNANVPMDSYLYILLVFVLLYGYFIGKRAILK